MGLILLVVPTLALLTLVFAAIYGKMCGFMQCFGYFVGYLLWFCAGFALLFVLPFDDVPWWFPFFLFWLLFGSIPHMIILIKGRREENRWKFRAGLLGVITTILASFGIEMLFYAGRFC